MFLFVRSAFGELRSKQYQGSTTFTSLPVSFVYSANADIAFVLSDVVRGNGSRSGDEWMFESICRCNPSHGINSKTLV